MSFAVVVLAAGRGVRMRSKQPKVLHPVGGVPMLVRVLSVVKTLKPTQTIVVAGAELAPLQTVMTDSAIEWVVQETPLGTGHAVLQALPCLNTPERILVVYGDMPLISNKSLEKLLMVPASYLGIITTELQDPTGFGRIVRDSDGSVVCIVEEKDATIEEKSIREVNTGVFSIPFNYAKSWLKNLKPDNMQKEYYLTDIVLQARALNVPIETITPINTWEVMGVNDKIQLAAVERCFQKEQARQLMAQGVTLRDPERFDLRGTLRVEEDVTIDSNVLLEGNVILEEGVNIGPNVYIRDSWIKKGAHIAANSVLDGAIVGIRSRVGPFARIRPGTELGDSVQVGNFVEIKNTMLGTQAKVNHLSYLGDATVGQKSNIGAGVITCNFDGIQKHRTVIGEHVFVGADSQLIAPVVVGDHVRIGAGTTVVKDVPNDCLIHNRISYRIVFNSKAKEKKAE